MQADFSRSNVAKLSRWSTWRGKIARHLNFKSFVGEKFVKKITNVFECMQRCLWNDGKFCYESSSDCNVIAFIISLFDISSARWNSSLYNLWITSYCFNGIKACNTWKYMLPRVYSCLLWWKLAINTHKILYDFEQICVVKQWFLDIIS